MDNSEAVKLLAQALEATNNAKTGERNEQQRRIAILATEIERALAWAHYCESA